MPLPVYLGLFIDLTGASGVLNKELHVFQVLAKRLGRLGNELNHLRTSFDKHR